MRFTCASVSAAVLMSADGQSAFVAGAEVEASEFELLLHAASVSNGASANAANLDIFFVLCNVLRMNHIMTRIGVRGSSFM